MDRSSFKALPFFAAAIFSLAARAGWTADCNGNGVEDALDISRGTSQDCNLNSSPDECDLAPGAFSFELGPRYVPVLPDIDPSTVARFSFAVPELADLDGDSDTDVVLPIGEVGLKSSHGISSRSVGFLAVYRNKGDGSLDSPALYETGLDPRCMPPVDIDGDGNVDLLVKTTQSLSSQSLPAISVFLNRGDGTFGPRRTTVLPLPTYGYYSAPKVVDLDGRMGPDVVIVRHDHDGDYWPLTGTTLLVYRNRGDGGFSRPLEYPVDLCTWRLEAPDLDGDGDQDLAATADCNQDTPEEGAILVPCTLLIFLNQGDGTFGEATVFQYPEGKQPVQFVAADLNRDGGVDLLTGNQCRSCSDAGSSNIVTLVKNLGGGAYAPPVDIPAGYDPMGLSESGSTRLKAGDLDGDGDLDLVVVTSSGMTLVFQRNASEGFTRGCAEFVRGDTNQDGHVSVADMLSFRRIFHEPEGPGALPCMDAADVNDDELVPDICDYLALTDALFGGPDWGMGIAAPFPEPGMDPSPVPPPLVYDCYNGDFVEVEDQRPSVCAEYHIREAEKTADVLRIGEVTTGPGEEVAIPVYVTSNVPVAAIQLVVAYDPALLEIRSGHEERSGLSVMQRLHRRDSSLSFEDTDYGEDGRRGPGLALISTHPSMGIFTVGITATFVLAREDQTVSIPPGEDRLVAWIHATVSGDAIPGTVISLVPTSGLDGEGVGPYRMRSEISYQGDARLVTLIPDLQQGTMGIVGDQAFFRGDSNGDDTLGLSDAIHTLGALFLGGLPLSCKDASDSNDDGRVDVSDAIHTLSFLFLGGPRPPPPYPEAGFDPTADALHCYRVGKQ